MASFIRLEVGHTLVLTNADGHRTRSYVREILEEGWMLEPYEKRGTREYLSSDQLEHTYRLGRMLYEPWDDDTIPAARRKRLRDAFSAYPEKKRIKALRRRVLIKAVEHEMLQGHSKGDALLSAPKKAVLEHADKWLRDDLSRAEARFKVRQDKGKLRPGENFISPKRFVAPCPRTMWTLMKNFVQSGGNINSLIDADENKGCRASRLSEEQDAVLSTFFNDHVKPSGNLDIRVAYAQVKKIMRSQNLSMVSRRTFKLRLERAFDRVGLARLQSGPKATRRMGKVSGSRLSPLWPLHQTESDHTLLNIKVLDDETGIDLGRPWLSAVKDRFTHAIVGLHVSFLPPSWATLSRVLAHSMWPKDLSGIEGLKGTWPVGGLFDQCFTDRGMDYISHDGRWAAAEMKFEILNLPGYSPWLKGSLERWNRTLKAEIMTYEDGVTSFKNSEFRGKNRPSVTFSELKQGLLSWLVDDYQSGIGGTGAAASINDMFLDAIEQYGPQRSVQDFDQFRRMMMSRTKRTIQNNGVEVRGFFYASDPLTEDSLTEIRKRYPAGHSFEILVDDWDVGYILLLDQKRWVTLFNRQTQTQRVTKYCSELYWKKATDAKPGSRVSEDDYLRAKEDLDDDADRILSIGRSINKLGSQNILGRYRDVGQFLTPIPFAPIVYKAPPKEFPGWTENGGVLRPSHMQTPSPMDASRPFTQTSEIDADAPTGSTENIGSVITKAPSVTGKNLFDTLAQVSELRAKELRR